MGDWQDVHRRLAALEAKSHTPVDFSPLIDRVETLEEVAIHYLRKDKLSVIQAGALEDRLLAKEQPRFNPDFMASPPEEPRMRFRTPERDKIIVPWFAVEDVKPPENVFLMVTGPSGYTTTPSFLCLAQLVPFESRPGARWLDEAGDGINGEYGYEVTHWAHPILLPGDLR